MIRRLKAALLRLLNQAAPARSVARFAAATSLGAVLLASDGCGPYADPLAAESGGRPECGSEALAKLTAGYAIELSQACGSTPIKQCADIAKKPIRDKWEPRFDAWAEECD